MKKIALAAGFDLPLYTVTGWDNTHFPVHEVTPVEGGYADQPWGLSTEKMGPSEVYAFRFDSRMRGNLGAETSSLTTGDAEIDVAHTPFLGAEFGGGVPTMYRRRPIMQPDDTAAMLPVELGSGVNLYGYYMFHGGQNSPDRNSLEENTSIGAYNDLPMIDYDFQAPLGAYGQQHAVLNKIRPFHYFLQAFGADLAPMSVHRSALLSKGAEDLVTPRLSVRSIGDRGFLFMNNYVRQYAMAVQKDVQFSVRLASQTVTFPSAPIDIPSGVYFIWPVNMDLSGATLSYATAQPITRIEDSETPVYIFHAQDGITTELAFDAKTIASVTANSGSITREAVADRYIVRNVQAGADAIVEIKTSQGKTVRLLVLSQSQAGQLTLPVLEGRVHLLLTDAQSFPTTGGLDILSTENPNIAFAVFPALALPNLTVKPTGRDGVFQTFEAHLPKKALSATLTKIRDAQPVPPLALGAPANTAHEPMPETFGKSAAWKISVSGLSGADDAFLRIRARGDVARIFTDSKMIDDHFLDGSTWEIGLDRFRQEIKSPLTLTVLPLRSDAPIYLVGGVAKMVSGRSSGHRRRATIPAAPANGGRAAARTSQDSH